jgi:hypothetical protein
LPAGSIKSTFHHPSIPIFKDGNATAELNFDSRGDKEAVMKFAGLILVLGGWLIPILGLNYTSSNGVRLVLCLIGIAVCLVGILGVLNKAYQEHAVWKR